MYTLRIIENTRENEENLFEQVIENFELGNSYSIIKKGSSKEFDSQLEECFENDKKDIRLLLCAENGIKFHILNNNKNRIFEYFIMTDSGKTFEKL